ncbi:hypothetical protein NM208_g1272 [Fusarium decemcellulare]|uniref:Uncharacterized protein n=1 Tax=Fusarium decemcellulare TaxID=57161 RepID=A0ACC1SWE4_9HYPO|nr:hypothetical protein NM208_g1272 [Fusarium decemcellulare]
MPRRKRSQGGCLNCRQRVCPPALPLAICSDLNQKVKCDEVRPSCSQCCKRGLQCPGYERAIRWSAKHEVCKPNPLPDPEPPGSKKTSKPRAQLHLSHSEDEFTSTSIAETGSPAQESPPSSQSASAPQLAEGLLSDLSSEDFRQSLQDWLLNQDCGLISGDADIRGFTDCNQDFFPAGATTCVPSPKIANIETRGTGNQSIRPQSQMRLRQSEQLGSKPEHLLQYFFANICILHSTFEDSDHSFKPMIQRFIHTSPLIFRCVVCISAIHCFQGDDGMLPVSLEYHSAAINTLSAALSQLEVDVEYPDASESGDLADSSLYIHQLREVLLASLLLGLTAPWLDPSNIGLPHLFGARRICQRLVSLLGIQNQGDHLQALSDMETNFLIGAMAYWEACMAFVVDQPLNTLDYLIPFSRYSHKVYPHSFTGLSTPIFITLGQVGICVRQKRALMRLDKFGWTDRHEYKLLNSELLESAALLETAMVQFTLPEEGAIQGHRPGSAAITQMKSFAEMYRFTALLELYRNFASLSSYGDSAGKDSFHSSMKSPSVEVERRIRDMSLLIISFAREIPEKNSWVLYQTLSFVISGSVLYSAVEAQKLVVDDPSCRPQGLDKALFLAAMRLQETNRCRDFIRQKLQISVSSFGLGRILGRALLLLEEVWRGFDMGHLQAMGDNIDENIPLIQPHWTEIMAERKLETFFG